MMLATTAPSSTLGQDVKSSLEDPRNNRWSITPFPTSKLLASNLPTLLFTQVSDLHPLFHPFGPTRKMEILSSARNATDKSLAAIIEYVDISSAQEAKDFLHFQIYAGHSIEVHYILDNCPAMYGHATPASRPPSVGQTGVEDRLNPFAVPFNLDFRGPPMQSSQLGFRYPGHYSDAFPLAPRPFPVHLRPYIADAISRSSSTTSSKCVVCFLACPSLTSC